MFTGAFRQMKINNKDRAREEDVFCLLRVLLANLKRAAKIDERQFKARKKNDDTITRVNEMEMKS